MMGKGKGMSLTIGLGKGAKGKEDGADEAKEMAGKAFARAVRSGDGLAVAEAFEELLACCDAGEDEEPEEEESEGFTSGDSDEDY